MAQFPITISTVFLVAIVLTTAQTQTAIEMPHNASVARGGTAEFTCVFNETVYIEWTILGQTNVGLNGQYQGYHFTPSLALMTGNIHTSYESTGDITTYTLHISNVTKSDSVPRINCRIFEGTELVWVSDWVYLTVWTPPKDPPDCSFRFASGNIPTVIPPNGLAVTLTCSLSDGDPMPTLQWQSSGGQTLSNNMTHMNTVNTTIFPEDNGQEYVCVAYSPALLKPSTCSVTPYEVPYLALISPPRVEISRNGTFNLICFDFGNSTLDTYFQWFWGYTSVDFLKDDTGVQIFHSHDGKSSTMKIDGGLAVANNEQNQLKVTCEILVSQSLYQMPVLWLYLWKTMKTLVKEQILIPLMNIQPATLLRYKTLILPMKSSLAPLSLQPYVQVLCFL